MTTLVTPELEKAERSLALYERLYPRDMGAYFVATRAQRRRLTDAAYDAALEALEYHDFGHDHEAAESTPEQFKAKFFSLPEALAYGYAIHTWKTYGGTND